MYTASGDAPLRDPSTGTVATIPHGAHMRDRFHRPEQMPVWLTEAELDVYANEFEHTGFSGALNCYRNVDRDWQDLAAFRGKAIEAPALFVGGDRDVTTIWGGRAIAAFETTLPKLHRSLILKGCGHWTQQERPDDVNEALIDFLADVRSHAL
jgi:pimeloyl-ACP methyl ester carboxylesterase